MDKIRIDQIAPSPNPVRKTWDEGKMEELAQSIRERGVIVPIKVRPNGKGYEVVYGHRRVEAARRAGLSEMPAIVEGVDDTEALIQALIENVQREDMEPTDLAHTLSELMELKGWSIPEMARQQILPEQTIRVTLKLLDESKEIQNMIIRHPGGARRRPEGTITREHVTVVREAGVTDSVTRSQLLKRAAKEDLTLAETEAMARAFEIADTPELKQKVLETSGKLGDSERILMAARMKMGGDKMMERKEYERRRAFEEYDQAVKDFIDAARLFDRMIKTARNATRYGKFSPEGARYTIRKIDQLIDELEQLKGVLNDVD